MWPLFTLLVLVGTLALHLWWTKRFRGAQAELAHQRQLTAKVEARQYQEVGQKQAEQEALLNSMAEGLLLLDREGHVQLVNRALEQLFGLAHDIRGKSMMEALRVHQLLELQNRVLKEGQVLGFELELPGLNQRFAQVNASAVLSKDGRQFGSVFVFHDLTRLKQLENTRQEFVANVSHELRTPLSLIKGYVETLIDGAKNNPQVATRFLQTIEKHTDRLTFLIEDLLTISRLESGQAALNLQQIELQPLVQRVVNDLGTKAEARNVRVQNDVPQELAVHADGDRLQQVFSNLIENAIKYGHSNGNVWVTARLDKKQIEISVRDDGPGIPPDSIERVFERFYRLDRARSRDQGGTGLGLSIVKHIVQSHEGDVWATSEPGGGTTFFFTIPCADNKNAQVGPERSNAA